MDLFGASLGRDHEPLAARMRPRTLAELVGQDHLVGEGRVLREALEGDRLHSLILYGPPGSGKTTLARIMAVTSRSAFVTLHAAGTGVSEVRRVLAEARDRLAQERRRTVLFLDEVHRFSKSQQDVLLAAVEDGTVILVGATTENPYFELNAALLSRAPVLRLEPLGEEDLLVLLRRALADPERGLGRLGIEADEEALRHLARVASGDARLALTFLEQAAAGLAAPAGGRRRLTLDRAQEASRQPALRHDRSGDQHYDVVSAFIKSLRGSDPDAALYWFARMLAAGEDPRFVVRRLLVHAAEDVGLADPQALLMAQAAATALEWVGLPEARIPIAQAIIYIATAPKSNRVVLALGRAWEDATQRAPEPVPVHLRDSSYPGARALGHGRGYLYPHDYPGHYVEQAYRPPGVAGRVYYEPSGEGEEAGLAARWPRARAGREGRAGGTPPGEGSL